MNIDIRDSEALRAIRPFFVASYLQSNGWKKVSSIEGFSSVWINGASNGDYEIILPMREEFRDYSMRIGDLLEVLSKVECRSQYQIYSDLLTVNSDVVRIRIADPELADGTLPIEEHALIAQRSRDLVLAAACAAMEHRSVWHNRKPDVAKDYVKRVRIGQTERGSFIIKLISSISPRLCSTQGELFEVEDPYERRVIKTLAKSLHALSRASEQAALTGNIDAFENAVPEGVSANLCDAVVGLWGGDDRQRNIGFSFSWSPTRPVDDKTANHIKFSSDHLPIIREAGKVMREKDPIQGFELVGHIVKLERQQKSGPGKVTIVSVIDDRSAKVSVILEEEEYEKAISTHKEGNSVSIIGTLVRDRQAFSLQHTGPLIIGDD